MSDQPINPLVHLNGTGEKTLKEGYDNAADKLRDFIEAWGSIEFNARDYYPLGDHAYSQARSERDEMGGRIHELNEYIQRIREDLYS